MKRRDRDRVIDTLEPLTERELDQHKNPASDELTG
jgi:hypothetical protein